MESRLRKVSEKLVAQISKKQVLCLRSIANNRKEEIQFGRFIGNEKVKLEEIESSLYEQFAQSCPSEGHILLLEDTSAICYNLGGEVRGLGKIDKGQVQGFYLHPVLGIDAANGACYGIADLKLYQRAFESKPADKLDRGVKEAKRKKTPFAQKESYRWLSVAKAAQHRCSPHLRKTVVADRESDVYGVLTGLSASGLDYVIRAMHNRPLQNNRKLHEEIATWQPQSYEIEVPATDKRSAHLATLDISFGYVELQKKDAQGDVDSPPIHGTWVVYAKESPDSVVGNEKPIEWVLYTSHPVTDFEMALQIIAWYKERWHIEQLFRTLKSKGLDLENSQLKTAIKLHKLAVLALMAAVKVIQLVRARDGKTDQKIIPIFSQEEQNFLQLVHAQVEGKTEKSKNPHSKDSLAFATWVIARLAGWSGYQSQRPPGPIDLLNGLKKFNQQYQGFLLAKHFFTESVYIP